MSFPSFDAAILFGRGMPRGEQEVMFSELAQSLVDSGAAPRVDAAFLEMTAPSLGERLLEYARMGLVRVVIVPAFTPFDRTVRRWLPRYLAFWKVEHGVEMDIVIAPAIETTAAFAQALRESLAAARGQPDIELVHKPLRNRQGLSTILEYRHQVQVCLGPRCVMAGAWAVYDELRKSLQAHGLESNGPHRVMPVRTACLQPCNFAPVWSVQPDNVWYGDLTPAKAREIVESHLKEGRICEALAYRCGEKVRGPSHAADMKDDYPMVDAGVGGMVVKNAFARPAMKIFDAGAVFMQLENTGDADDRLIAVRTPLSPRPRIHDGTISHRQLNEMEFEPLTVPARGTVALKPGELHMMLLKLRTELIEGDPVPLTLEFERAGVVELNLVLHPIPGVH